MASYVVPAGLSQTATADFERRNEQNGLAVGIWQDRATGIELWFRAGDERNNVKVSLPDTSWHDVKVSYVGMRYTSYVDNRLVYASQPTIFRPNSLWIGHPAQLDLPCAWSRLDIGFVTMETLP